MNIPELTTERLRLRTLRADDFEAFAHMDFDAETMRFLGGVASREEAWCKLAMLVGHWHLRGFGMWAVESLATGELVGRVGFHQPEGWPDFELGGRSRASIGGRVMRPKLRAPRSGMDS